MNWEEFLQDHHITYVTRGPNTKKGEVSVRCPWCGDDDPSEHLGISLSREAWGCHRSHTHRGKGPVRLVQALLGVSNNQAKLIVSQYDRADPENLEQAIDALEPTYKVSTEPMPSKLRFPPEFRHIGPEKITFRFWNYLMRRGFSDPERLAATYDLKCCSIGQWKDRIIVPIYRDHTLIAWTGRAIQSTINAPRYLSTSDVIKKTIFNEDEVLEGGEILFITEGPFDALKMDFYGYALGARATCVFGTSMTIDQISILKKAAKNFKKVVLLLDPDALETSFNTLEWLPEAVMGTLPAGAEDPGALLRTEVRDLVSSFRN